METNVLNKGAKQLRQRWSHWVCQMSKRKLFTSAGDSPDLSFECGCEEQSERRCRAFVI